MRKVLAISALLASTGLAGAADIPARVPVRTPAAAPVAVSYVDNWTGCHIGINGGYGWGSLVIDVGGADVSVNGFDGAVAGGQIGCLYQMNSFVIGIEGDGQWSDLNRVDAGVTYGMNWFATARGIVGFAVNNVLFYGTGGYAHLGFKAEQGALSESSNRGGWTAGGGVKRAFGNWAIGAEYLFIQSFNEDVFGTDVRAQAHIARAKLEYRFGGGPVVARY